MAYPLLLAVVDAAVIVAAFVGAYFFRFGFLPMVPGIGAPLLEPYLYPLPLVAILWLVILKAFGLYSRHKNRFGLDTVGALFAAAALAAIFLGAVGFVYRGFSYSRLVLITAATFAFLGLCLSRAAAVRARAYLLRRGVGARRALVVGASPGARELCRRLRLGPASDYYLVGSIAAGENDAAANGCPVLGELEDFFDVVRRENVGAVFFGSDVPDPVLLDLVVECDLKGIEVRIIPSPLELMASKIYVDGALGVPLFALKQFRLRGVNRFVKRALDVVFAVVAVAALAPLWAVIALAIKLTSRGPVFYRQERVGQDGRTFELLKFRSMRENAEAETGPVFAREGDERVTPFGRFLRRTSLDELPQLLNVLRGDMSVVGPRPERPVFVRRFASDIPRYLERHKVKSGMTGWAQVNGLRGNTSIARRVEYDVYYIENWSLWLDLRIILRTIGQVIKGAGR